MEFLLACVKVGFGCAVGFCAFMLTLFLVLMILVGIGQIGKKLK